MRALAQGRFPCLPGLRGSHRETVVLYKPVILMCPSSSSRMLKEREENRCFTRGLASCGMGCRPRGHSRAAWVAVPMRGSPALCRCGLQDLLLPQSAASAGSRVDSDPRCLGLTRQKLGPAGLRPSLAHRKVQEPFRPSCMKNVIERAQDCLGLWTSGAS